MAGVPFEVRNTRELSETMPASALSADRLADDFSRILGDWLTPSELAEIRRRNATPDYSGVCASHDFCDANEAMAQALAVQGLEFSSGLCGVVDEAWHIAKGREFRPAAGPQESVWA